VGDHPGDNCQRLQATSGDQQLALPQLEAPIERLHGWYSGSMTSLTRKRSLVQSQYRPTDQRPYGLSYKIIKSQTKSQWV